ncbi:MAG: polyphenol oxidase family protein [Actinomycetota bacterium]
MHRRESVAIGSGTANVCFTDRADGDLRALPPEPTTAADRARWVTAVAARRAAIVDRPWTWLRQVHGARAVLVPEAGVLAGAQADAALTNRPGCPVAVAVADCAPVILVAEEGVAAVHAGWRGLVGGVVDAAASQLRAVAGPPVATFLGPCISPAAYEFGPADLDDAARALGQQVRARTAWDTPALDVPAAVAVACERAGWPLPAPAVACTSDEAFFSHRTRADTGRQVAVTWIEPDENGSAGP